MGLRSTGQRWVVWCVVALTSTALAHEFVGTEGPAWMRRQVEQLRSRQAAGVVPSASRNITNNPAEDRDASWSADGTLIAFASNRNGDFDIFVCRTDGSHPDTGAANSARLVSGQPGNERYPAWSPGGTEIAYVRDAAIYLRNLISGTESLVANNVGEPRGLVFSFDGQRLAFSSRIGTDVAPNIYWISLNPNNRTLTKVTDTVANDIEPAWFPRSTDIIFASDRDGDYDLWVVTVPGPGAGPVPEGDPRLRKLIGGIGDQRYPAWVNAGGITTDPTYDQPFHILYADNADSGGAHFDLKLADSDEPTPDPQGNIVFTDGGVVNPANQFEPVANPVQSAASNLCAFTNDAGGNAEIYTIELFDGSPPILAGIDPDDGQYKALLPTVTPQQTFPGADVTIQARVYDIRSGDPSAYQSTEPGANFAGVSEAWAIIRAAEQPIFQRNNIFTGTGTDVGVINSSGDSRVAMGANNVEFDQFVVNANTGALVDPTSPATFAFPPTQWAALTLAEQSQLALTFAQTYGVRLYDDGVNGGDAVANDGVFTGRWTTTGSGQDFYVDVIPVDIRNNVPVDLNLGVNSRPGGGTNPLALISNGFVGNGGTPFYVIGYDHVAGFTTRQLDLTRKILFVSDYACGQKFQVADFAGADQAALTRFWPAALPIERSYFSSDDNNGDGPADTPMFAPRGPSPPTVHLIANPYLGAFGAYPPPGTQTTDNAMIERFGSPADDPYGGPDQRDSKAVWRILCRGPVDAPTYNAYSPRSLPQPAGSPIPAQDADRMLLWISPYTGDLFVADGTLLDADVQSALTGYVRSGGRMFVTGQDIAWALTKNGTQTNAFLRDVLRANFVSDAAADVQNSIVQVGAQRRDMTVGSAVTGIEQQIFITTQNPITHDLYFDGGGGQVGFYRWREPNGGFHPPDDGDSLIRINGGGPGGNFAGGTGFAGSGAPNAWFIDDITPNNSIPTLTYSNGGQTAMVRYIDATTGGRVVYAAFPFEALRNNFRYYPGYTTNTNWVISHHDRMEMFTNISDYLRTGALLGKVVGPDGSTPVGGVTVIARRGALPTGQIMATTTSLNDGSYLLAGLSTGVYSIYVQSNEFTADHRPFIETYGGQVTQNSDLTIRLLRFETGTIFGTVTQTGGATVSGATVRATIETVGTNPFSATVQTDNNGQYSLAVPGGTYAVTAEATGFGSASRTNVAVVPGDFIQVDLELQPGPGTLAGNVSGNGRAVGGASVAIVQNAVTVATTTTNGAGNYTVELPAGSYDVVVSASGFQQARRAGIAVVSEQLTAGIDFELTAVPPGALSGLVTLQGNNAPLGDVLVNLVAAGAILRSTTTAATVSTGDGASFNYRFADVPAGTYDVQVQAQGFSAEQRTGVQVVSGQVTTNINFALEPLHTFIAGLSMTSTPFSYTAVAADIQTLIDDDGNRATPLRLATWDPLGQRYIYYPNRPADTFRLGVGYFMRLSQNVPLTTEGIRAPVDGRGQDIQLLTGWNLIGHVYEFPVDLFSCQVVYQGQVLTLQQASAQGLVNAVLFTLNFNQYQQVFRLDPYTAYWFRAFQNVLLRVPATSLRSAADRPAPGRQAPTSAGWQAELVASGASGRQANALFGVRLDSADVYDQHDRALPPAPPGGGTLELSFPHPDWGRYSGHYLGDIRQPNRSLSWDLEVRWDGGEERIDLTWPSLGGTIPSNLSVVLEDRATGWRRSLRHTSNYQFSPGAASGTRQFRLTVSPRGQGLAIGPVNYARGRGAGGQVSFTLSAPAMVDIVVRGVGGSVVRELVTSRQYQAGSQAVEWDGRDANGRLAPSGTYRIEVIGVTDLGEQVRVTRTVQHRR